MSAPSFTYSGNVYTAGTAGTVDFALTSTTGNPIPYLEPGHIHVYKSANQGTSWTELARPAQWDFVTNGTVARLAAGIAAGEWVKVQRITPSNAAYVTFQASSLLTAAQLNDDTLFNTYLNQELEDQSDQSTATSAAAEAASAAATSTANTALSTANSASAAAATAVSTANTASTNASAAVSTANTASTNASAAVSTANAASTNASAAVSTANTASSNASTALSTANTALTNANTAVTTANNANTTAQAANTTATNAESIANSALSLVTGVVNFEPVANVAAIPSSPNDGDAVQVVDSTGIQSFTPLSGLPSGFTGTPQLFVRLQYDQPNSTWVYSGYGANDPDNRYVVQGVLGTANNPSFYFDGDTGVYSPGANELGLSTGGTARLTIDSAGGVAIPGSLAVTGALTKSGSNVVTVGDTGTVTSAMLADGTIVNADVNASAAIAGTKISPDFGSQSVTTSGTITSDTVTTTGAFQVSRSNLTKTLISDTGSFFTADVSAGSFVPTGSTVPTNGVYLPSANNVAISTNGTGRLFVDSSGRVGLGTSSPDAALTAVGSATISSQANVAARIGPNVTSDVLIGSINGNTPFIASQGAYPLALRTNATTALTIDSSQRVGIGTTAANQLLHINSSAASGGQLQITNASTGTSSTDGLLIGYDGLNDVLINNQEATALKINVNGSERARIDSSGRLLVGTSTASTTLGALTAKLQVQGTSVFDTGITNALWESSSNPAQLQLVKSRGASIGTQTVVQNNDNLGRILFGGSDGTDFETAAWIQCDVDGTPGANDMPGRLVFSTTADGASSPSERMRLTSGGTLLVGGTTDSGGVIAAALQPNGAVRGVTGSATCFYANRRSDDGNLVEFYQADTLEGTISVSGTTVSYNGAHLSRYSQLPGGAERTEILRGTVLSNIDEMCAWDEEDNEQLNRMKVSDVEGDPNVAGVFQAWDDDDDTYTDDFYCAMTGDFIIRIADGVTVQRGDLLMSAGDGTAKPQDDDIIRRKTIAKVTSTHVACTYDDGSYCVPCVLMAC